MRTDYTLIAENAMVGISASIVRHGDYLWLGWAAEGGNLVAARWNGNRWSAPFVCANYGQEYHNYPVFCVLPNGMVATFYTHHVSGSHGIFMRQTASAFGVDFGAQSTILAASTGYGYLHPVVIGARVWMFYTKGSATRDVCYITSDDDGATWSGETKLWQSTSARAYFSINKSGSDLLFATSRDHADATPGTSNGYFARWSDTNSRWEKADGTAYTLPITTATGEVCFNASALSRNFGYETPIHDDGTRVFFTTVGYGASDADRRYVVSWNGAAWVVNAFPAETDGVSTGGGWSLVDDPQKSYVMASDGTRNQVFAYSTSDYGATWGAAAQLTNFAGIDDVGHSRPPSNSGTWATHRRAVASNSVWTSDAYLRGKFFMGNGAPTPSAPAAAVNGSALTLTVTETYA